MRKYYGEIFSRGSLVSVDVHSAWDWEEKILNEPEQQCTLKGVDGFEHKLSGEK